MMDKATPILESPQWKNASPKERELIFARRVAKDPDYANADAETQAMIRQRFGLGDVTPTEEVAPTPAPAPAPAKTEAPVEAPAEATAEAPKEEFSPVAPLPEHIANAPAAQAGGTDNFGLAMVGGGIGAVKGLLEKYLLSTDKLQRDLYARSIKNVLSQAGIDLSKIKDEATLIDMARNLSGQQLAGICGIARGRCAIQQTSGEACIKVKIMPSLYNNTGGRKCGIIFAVISFIVVTIFIKRLHPPEAEIGFDNVFIKKALAQAIAFGA